MRTPTFQEWQHMRSAAGSSEPLTVVVVEYRADGCAVERERVTLFSHDRPRQLTAFSGAQTSSRERDRQ